MPDIIVEDDVAERIEDFRELFADRTQSDLTEVDLALTANAILSLGLDLMMADFFMRLDESTLRRSIQIFYERHPNCQRVERANVTCNELADLHVALSRRYPKQFFAFVLEMLKADDWAKARERFDQLFSRADVERNGHA